MTLGSVYEMLYDAALPVYGDREGKAVCMTLMEDIYGADRVAMALGRDREVDDGPLNDILCQLSSGRPVQYITGRAYFGGHILEVSPGVLIPRPETAELVQWVISDAHVAANTETDAAGGQPLRILDIGTGSGAIAVSLAAALKQAEVAACDVSPAAIGIARRNAAGAGVDIEFTLCDILRGPQPTGPYEIIVSNPPYIPASEARTMHINVKDHEPGSALFVPDDDPLLFYRAIGLFAIKTLTPRGRLYFEVHENFALQTGELLHNQGYTAIEIRRDIHGRERMIKALKRTDG